MRNRILSILIGLVLVSSLPACVDMDIPDFNNSSVDEFENNPTPSGIATLATGLLIGYRRNVAEANGYVLHLGIVGREGYNFDPADPRFIEEMLIGPLDSGSRRFGGNFWTEPYSNIRNANILLNATNKVAGVSEEEKEAIRGFTKTIQALDFLTLINTRDRFGAAVDVGGDIDQLGPIVSKDEMFSHIADLLDEARAHLSNASDEFPFPLSSGFEAFYIPTAFIKLNRAVKSRVDVYRGEFEEALENLSESFLHVDSADPQFDLGAYHVFGTGSGDLLNRLNVPSIYAHPSIETDADTKADNNPDDRLTQKTVKVDPITVQGITTDVKFTLYQSVTAPVPIIRNEELILLRAEANIGLGYHLDAAADINFVRVHSGGLEERNDLTADNILDELLKQKRYSLLFEGGHRWIDLRRYGKLDSLPLDRPDHVVHDAFPIPKEESDARE